MTIWPSSHLPPTTPQCLCRDPLSYRPHWLFQLPSPFVHQGCFPKCKRGRLCEVGGGVWRRGSLTLLRHALAHFSYSSTSSWPSLRMTLKRHTPLVVAQMVKNPPAVQEKTQVRSLGQEDPLEKGMETHSSILAWRIPWTEKPGRLQSMGSQRVGHD